MGVIGLANIGAGVAHEGNGASPAQVRLADTRANSPCDPCAGNQAPVSSLVCHLKPTAVTTTPGSSGILRMWTTSMGYLRVAGLVSAPVTLTIHQGREVGRPSLITVEIPAEGGIVVTGNAVPMEILAS